VKNAGLIPALPPLEPGGDYWDTAFLQACLESLLRRRERYLIDHLAISLYAWTYDRALDWGKGGPSKWQHTRPYFRPNGSQDQVGVRIFDWYEAVAQEYSARQIPILTVGGGVNARYATADDAGRVEQTLAIIEMLEQQQFPASMLNFNFFLLAAEPDSSETKNAWFPGINQTRAVVNAVRERIERLKDVQLKPLEHYILLPESIDTVAIEQFEKVNEILQKANPVIGYSAIEAQLAETVSLVGDISQISEEVEAELQAAGCQTQRIEQLCPEIEVVEFDSNEDYVQSFINRVVGDNNERIRSHPRNLSPSSP
jgi:phosphohistidine swiveling domain-containing protein